MRKRKLLRPVTLQGHNLLGYPTMAMLAPREVPGVVWVTPSGAEVPITRATLGYNCLMHCLTLTHGRERLWGVEHVLGCLYAYGLDYVNLNTGPRGLPYSGTAQALSSALQGNLYEDGELERYAPKSAVEIRDPKNPTRYLVLDRQGSKKLTYEVWVDYGQPDNFAMIRGELDTADLDALCAARPYWRPLHRAAGRLATAMGTWPHKLEECAVDFAPAVQPQRRIILREIALHRLLDFLGRLATLTPAGSTIVGHASMRLAGHQYDMEMGEQLKQVGLERL